MKSILIIFVVIFSVTYLAAGVVRTATMDSVLVENLREAVDSDGINDDEVMDFYYDKLNPYSTRYEEGEDDWRETRASYKPIEGASYFANRAFLGAVDVEIDEHSDEFLGWGRDYLLDPDFTLEPLNPETSLRYLDLDSVWVSVADGRGAFDIAYVLIYGGMIVDMLWYYVTPAEQNSLYNILNEVAYFAYLVLEDHEPDSWVTLPDSANVPDYYPDTFSINTNNIRLYFAAALGYAGCVLGNTDYVTTAEEDMFTHNFNGHNGILGLNMSNDGIYSEGFLYGNVVSNALGIFISTRRRVEIAEETKNWYADSEDVQNLYENNLLMYAPDFGGIHFEDSFQRYLLANGELSDIFTNTAQLVTCYYQCSDDNTRSHAKWFHNNWIDNELRLSIGAQNLMCYRDVGNITEVMPEYIKSSYSGNSQFTVLRNDVEDELQFYNSPTLIVNHEDYIDHQEHEHSDQTSFILYYKARQLLIDPGYLPTSGNYYIAKEWLASPFAHNLVMVNPEWQDETHNEDDELLYDYSDSLISDVWNGPSYNEYAFNYRDFEPIGRTWEYSQHDDDEIPPANFPPYNSSQRNYIIENEDIEHLQVEITYDHPQLEYGGEYNGNADDIINVKRNFYFVDKNLENPYFIIYDEVSSSDNSFSNTFMNQLHFAVHPDEYNTNYPWEDDLQFNQQNGQFYFDTAEDVTSTSPNPAKVYLHGAMGSQDDFQIAKKDSLPQGLFLGKNWDNLAPPQWEHKALRIETETAGDEKFLTLLIPSECDTIPIYVENSTDGYGVKYKINPYDTFDTYAAVYSGDTHFRFLNDLMQFNTCSDFFLIETNSVCSDIRKLILNGDNRFEIHDLSGTRFDDVLVFDSDYDFEEMIATYELDGLNLVFKTEWNDHPKYKILKCEVEPENFHASSYFDYYLDGTQPAERYYFEHIQSLAYDNDYFYIHDI